MRGLRRFLTVWGGTHPQEGNGGFIGDIQGKGARSSGRIRKEKRGKFSRSWIYCRDEKEDRREKAAIEPPDSRLTEKGKKGKGNALSVLLLPILWGKLTEEKPKSTLAR